MRDARIAILIDGGYFLHRLPKLVRPESCRKPKHVAVCIRSLCRDHVKNLTGDEDSRWHRHVYRIFYYDAAPYDGRAHHPLLNKPIDFATSDVARFRLGLFDILRKQRKLALRLGKVTREGDWTLPNHRIRKLLPTRTWFDGIDFSTAESGLVLTTEQKAQALRLQKQWRDIRTQEVALALRQKGVDMRIGLDIASITLKRQADTIVLVAGDSDFVPAAKLARREGMEFVLDPLWQQINPDLFEHIDGLHSGLPKPKAGQPGTACADAESSPDTGTRPQPEEVQD